MLALANFVVSATEVAVRATGLVMGTHLISQIVGTVAGAVYVVAAPLAVLAGEIVPQAGEQAWTKPWLSVQVTPASVASLLTVAVNCCVPFSGTFADVGEAATVIAKTVIVAEAKFVESATEAAVRATLRLLDGAADGAVYFVAAPLAVDVGETEPHDAVGQETLHLTPLLAESFATVALNCAVAPACTVAVLGETETLMAGGGVVRLEEPPHPKMLAARNTATRIPVTDMRIFGVITSLPFGPGISRSVQHG